MIILKAEVSWSDEIIKAKEKELTEKTGEKVVIIPAGLQVIQLGNNG